MGSIGTWWLWRGFAVAVLGMLAVDLVVVGAGRQPRVSFKAAALWSVVWVAAAMAFAGVLWWHLEGTVGAAIANARTLEFVTGYLIEQALTIDNVFVCLMVVGLKMLLIDIYTLPIALALGLVVAIIGASIVLSLRRSNQTAVLNRDCPALAVRK